MRRNIGAYTSILYEGMAPYVSWNTSVDETQVEITARNEQGTTVVVSVPREAFAALLLQGVSLWFQR